MKMKGIFEVRRVYLLDSETINSIDMVVAQVEAWIFLVMTDSNKGLRLH
jgi:glycerol-3-phosphate responsive antiterminator